MPHSIQISRYGGPEVLELVETSSTTVRHNEVKIRVSAAGVNFADLMMRMGLYPEAPPRPFTPGYEISGTVVEVGPAVTSFKPGDRVFGATRFGGYTSETVVPEDQIWKTPANLSDIEAAAIPVNFITAWLALEEMARVRQGDRVLIPSAAGGVGVAAIQIAARAGAKVTGLVGSRSKMDLVRSLGAENVLLNEEWESMSDAQAGRYDIMLDAVGGKALKRSFRRTAPVGRVIHYGASGMVRKNTRSIFTTLKQLAQTPFFHPLQLMKENKGVFGLNVLQVFEPKNRDIAVKSVHQILECFEKGEFRVVIGKTFPLAEASAAHSYLQSRQAVGKVILTCS
ncbi:MAG: alcohol dehydrogenase catalytic domain-containing protein [Bdellovibrionia bacterium]